MDPSAGSSKAALCAFHEPPFDTARTYTKDYISILASEVVWIAKSQPWSIEWAADAGEEAPLEQESGHMENSSEEIEDLITTDVKFFRKVISRKRDGDNDRRTAGCYFT